MKVFISWSGEPSKRVATLLRDWIPNVLQAVRCYLSLEDIEKGSRWFEEISRELRDSSFGIVCLTRSNVERPWLNYEAGAIANKVGKSNLTALLIDIEEADLTGPLVLFHHTRPVKDDVFRLVKSLNGNLADPLKLSERRLQSSFEQWWPEFEEKYGVAVSTDAGETEPEPRSAREVLEEILRLSRSMNMHGVGRAPENYLLRELLEKAFEAKLTERERKILVLHYGLDDGESMNDEQIGELIGESDLTVRELRAEAVSKLI